MKDIISKLINERFELIEKIQNLANFVSEYSQVFNDKYLELLNDQYSIMVDYAHVLDDRIAMLKGEKCPWR